MSDGTMVTCTEDEDWEMVKIAGLSTTRLSAATTQNKKDTTTDNVATLSSTKCKEDDDEAITKDIIEHYRELFEKDYSGLVSQNACQQNAVNDITLRRDIIQNCNATDYTYSVQLEGGGMQVTDQRSSGRCWLFASLNIFRIYASNILDVNQFEFSEAYLHFYDKLEKANIFLERIIQTANTPLDDRALSIILSDPISDGGDWTIFVNLVTKYGLVPKYAYPESYTSKHTSNMNNILEHLLLASANELRSILSSKGSDTNNDAIAAIIDKARCHKHCRMNDVWRVLCIHLGTPPEQFHWQWRDKDDTFHPGCRITPQEFFKQVVVDDQWKTYTSLIQDPRHEYYQTYMVKYSNTVVGGKETIFLNVTSDEMKDIAQRMLQDGIPVWFACNVGEEFADDPGFWDVNLYEYNKFYNISKSFTMNKADRIRMGYPMGTHAMLLTGVDIPTTDNDGHTRRWRVENSWGTEHGNNGYYTMQDNWFDEYVFEIIVPPKYLSKEMDDGMKKPPVVLPAWDAMCSSRRK